jgi:hypothetical protein
MDVVLRLPEMAAAVEAAVILAAVEADGVVQLHLRSTVQAAAVQVFFTQHLQHLSHNSAAAMVCGKTLRIPLSQVINGCHPQALEEEQEALSQLQGAAMEWWLFNGRYHQLRDLILQPAAKHCPSRSVPQRMTLQLQARQSMLLL